MNIFSINVIKNKARIAEVKQIFVYDVGKTVICQIILAIKSFEMPASAISSPLLPLSGSRAPSALTRRHQHKNKSELYSMLQISKIRM